MKVICYGDWKRLLIFSPVIVFEIIAYEVELWLSDYVHGFQLVGNAIWHCYIVLFILFKEHHLLLASYEYEYSFDNYFAQIMR